MGIVIFEQFDVFFSYVKFDKDVNYNSKLDGKNRPVVVVEICQNDEVITIMPVFSYRSWFDESRNKDKFIEIYDIQNAGLDNKVRSFVDISRQYDVALDDIVKSRKFGHLSHNDIERLITAIERYYDND